MIRDITTNFGFKKIEFSSETWHQDEWDNLDKLDALLEANATAIPFAVDTGAADAYVVTYTPAITSYTTGLVLSFRPTNVNTGASTINVNGLGAKDIKFKGAAISAGDLPDDGYVKIIYNGVHFELIEPKIVDVTIEAGSITPNKLSTGAPQWDASGNITGVNDITATGNAVAAHFKSPTGQEHIRHASNSYTSGNVTFSTAAPSGGSDGDIWFKY